MNQIGEIVAQFDPQTAWKASYFALRTFLRNFLAVAIEDALFCQ